MHLNEAIKTGLFSHVWVQFYNNAEAKCQYAQPGDASDLENDWRHWTATVPSGDVFLGLPAGKSAANSGYIDAGTLRWQVLPAVQGAANYGGVMLWDRAADAATGYGSSMRGNV
jgi:chitinase